MVDKIAFYTYLLRIRQEQSAAKSVLAPFSPRYGRLLEAIGVGMLPNATQTEPITGNQSPGIGGISPAADDHPHVAKRQRRNSVGSPEQPILLPIDLLEVGDLGSLSRLD